MVTNVGKPTEKYRNEAIDLLKFIALVGLVIDHVTTNRLLLQLRSFDVNLLVLLSAMLISGKVVDRPYIKFYKKRLSRLLLPTWVFLLIYFIVNSIFQFQCLSIKDIVKTLLLLNTPVGYVWIVYVYCICALLIPAIQKISLNSKCGKCVLIFLICVYAVLVRLSNNYYYRIIILYPIIYGLIMLVGMNWNNFTKTQKIVIITANILIYASLAIYYKIKTGEYLLTGDYKYPPRLYYLAYSLGIALLLYEIIKQIQIKNRYVNRVCLFYSSFSLWFYLWHILVLQIVYRITSVDVIKFILVMSITTVIIFLQKMLVKVLRRTGVKDNICRILEG